MAVSDDLTHLASIHTCFSFVCFSPFSLFTAWFFFHNPAVNCLSSHKLAKDIALEATNIFTADVIYEAMRPESCNWVITCLKITSETCENAHASLKITWGTRCIYSSDSTERYFSVHAAFHHMQSASRLHSWPSLFRHQGTILRKLRHFIPFLCWW